MEGCVPFKTPSQSEDGSTNGPAVVDSGALETSAFEVGAAGKPLGAACTSDGQCGSGHCADGVCCSMACGEQCHSCKAVDTGMSDGMCSLVRAGLSHRDDCVMTASTSCGTDGTCDGAGNCRKWGTETTCGPSSCPAASSSFVAAAACDGNGKCAPGNPSSCGAYRCDDSTRMCRADCSGANDCSPGAYCGAGKCSLLKKDGVVCARNAECASGTCGGRCCPLQSSCSCPQPSAGNLVKNGGFDGDVSGWTIEPNDGEVSWLSSDAADCPFSGSIKLSVSPGESGRRPRISQCVTSAEGKFHFAVKAMCLSTFCTMDCAVEPFDRPGCVGTGTSSGPLQWYNAQWGTVSLDPVVPQGGSVRVSCELEQSATDTMAAVLDMFGLTPPPAEY